MVMICNYVWKSYCSYIVYKIVPNFGVLSWWKVTMSFLF